MEGKRKPATVEKRDGLRPTPRQAGLAAELTREFMAREDKRQAAELMRFFKTGPGQYGEGDRFLGIKVPVTRTLIKPYRNRLTEDDFASLLDSEWHEIRLAALLLMADHAERLAKCGDAEGLHSLVALYDAKLERANNWDLVDLSAPGIMSAYWNVCDSSPGAVKKMLRRWADSGNLWRERTAVLSTLARQRAGSLDETFWLAEYFIAHPHDLMHKACGWMLREAGKRDIAALRSFLEKFHTRLPRTALRYAIERMDADERKKWMARG